MLFEIERTTVSGRPSLTVRGELDLSTVPELAVSVDAQLAAGPHAFIIDLTPTRFLDSSGARGLVRAAKQAASAGVTLHIICPRSNSPVRLVVDMLELHRLVPVVETAAEVTTPVAERNGRP